MKMTKIGRVVCIFSQVTQGLNYSSRGLILQFVLFYRPVITEFYNKMGYQVFLVYGDAVTMRGGQDNVYQR